MHNCKISFQLFVSFFIVIRKITLYLRFCARVIIAINYIDYDLTLALKKKKPFLWFPIPRR